MEEKTIYTIEETSRKLQMDSINIKHILSNGKLPIGYSINDSKKEIYYIYKDRVKKM